jgi:tripartite-type tricarboxylate transporter receptor subunit TctC
LRTLLTFYRILIAAVAGFIACGGSQAADYSGKTIRIVVGAGAASSYALYGQLVAQHLGRHLPGGPTTIVSFMPGASGLTAMNYLYDAAAKDGATIGVAMQDLSVQQALSARGVRSDARAFGYIGRATSNVPVHYAWRTSRIRNFSDVKMHHATSGASSPSGSQTYLPKATNAMLGTKWRVISGYGDPRERHLAMERGEVDAGIAGAALFRDQLSDHLKNGHVIPIVQYASSRHPLFQHVPTIIELADTDESRRLLSFLVADIGRSFIAPPGVDSAQLDTLRAAFAAMINDVTFLNDAHRRGADIDYMSGIELAQYVREVLDTPPDIVTKAKSLIQTDARD